MLIDASRSQVLIVDVQSRLVPALSGGDDLVGRLCGLIRAASILDIPVTLVEENPAGLGPTLPAVRQAAGPAPVFAKMTFAATGEGNIADHLACQRRSGREHVVLAGAEAHVCVLQSALALIGAGYRVAVAIDAIASRRDSDRDAAIQRMMASGITIVTREMIAFEWLRTASSPKFKQILGELR